MKKISITAVQLILCITILQADPLAQSNFAGKSAQSKNIQYMPGAQSKPAGNESGKEALNLYYHLYSKAFKTGDYIKALDIIKKALKTAESFYGADNLNTAAINDNVALVYLRLKEYDKAAETYKISLAVRIKLLGKDHLEVGQTYGNIGMAYHMRGTHDRAIINYKKSLEIYQKTEGRTNPRTVQLMQRIGRAYQEKGDYRNAVDYYKQVLGLRRELYGESHPDVAESYNSLGSVSLNAGYSDAAIAYYRKALTIVKSRLGESHVYCAFLYNNIGLAFQNKGDFKEALASYRRSVGIYKKAGGESSADIATVYSNIGEVYDSRGDFDTAVDYFKKALAIDLRTRGEKHPDVAVRYNNLGGAYSHKGDYDRAIEHFQKAIALFESHYGTEMHPRVASSYNNLGAAYYFARDIDRAIAYYRKALDIRLKVLDHDHQDLAISYNNLGTSYNYLRQFGRSLEYYRRSLAIVLKKYGNDHPETATAYNNIAQVFHAMKDFENALVFYKKALDISSRKLGAGHSRTALVHNNMAVVHAGKGDYDRAVVLLRKALAITRGSVERGRTVTFARNLGFINLNKKNYNKAKEAFEEGISIIEKARGELGAGGTAFTARNIDTYYYSLKASALLKDNAGVFNTIERMRARGFLERLSLQSALSAPGIDPSEARELMKLNDEIESLAAQRSDEIKKPAAEQNPKMLLTISTILEKAEKAFAALDSKFMKNQLYRELRKPKTATLKEARKLCATDTVILEYALWEESNNRLADLHRQSYCLAITGNGEKLIKLDRDYRYSEKIDIFRTYITAFGAEIFVSARDRGGETKLFPVYTKKPYSSFKVGTIYKNNIRDDYYPDYILEKDGRVFRAEWIETGGDDSLALSLKLVSKKFTGFRKIRIIEKKDITRERSVLSFELYSKLIKPLEEILKGNKRLIIVPDGALAFLPFDALQENTQSPYLCENYIVTLTPSVSVMTMVKKRKYSDMRNAMLAFGGARYDKEASSTVRGRRRSLVRGSALTPKTRAYYAAISRSAYYNGLGCRWNNLPGTGEEVESLNEAVYGKRADIIKGEKVTEGLVKKMSRDDRLGRYKSVHFALHGYYDHHFPSYSAVIFSEVSNADKSGDDGYLSVEEVALLKFKADIVNLSACETGLGKIVKGDGIVGLTRAFQVAGANRVGVTLWQVEDEATRDFMVGVYQKVVTKKMSFGEAYNRTRREFIRSAEFAQYRDPYYWSPFVLYGE